MAHLELLNLTGAIPAPAEETSGERPKPCSGALCSGNPAPPLSTMPSVPSPTGGQWVLPVFLVSQLGSGVFQRLPADTDVCPVDHSCSIFHPPRFQITKLNPPKALGLQPRWLGGFLRKGFSPFR